MNKLGEMPSAVDTLTKDKVIELENRLEGKELLSITAHCKLKPKNFQN